MDRYLDDLDKRFGGIDSVLIWPVYPNIGIDNRNQFDCFRDMPGGTAGIRQMVADFHRRGVRVLFPIMLWDQGKPQEPRNEYETLAENLAAVGADGVNGDTMGAVPRMFRIASDTTWASTAACHAPRWPTPMTRMTGAFTPSSRRC